MSGQLPISCQVALKEWASVIAAMERGEQLVLIRKGGLIEPAGGFQVVSQQFLLYPTFEHQTVNFIRSAFQRDFDEAMARKPTDGKLQVRLVGVVEFSTEVHDPACIKRLEPFHIYNEAFLAQRLRWQPEQPLALLVVRAFRLAAPQHLPMVDRYAGCKSWVELDQPIRFDGASPVLDDQTFNAQLARIQAIVGTRVGDEIGPQLSREVSDTSI
ncbi:MAG: DUF1802 family protein [Candidatus Omnitrophica bacterium]|nr:DUF1802 family protein [Candidatus Omnitrophota bacterium]